MFGWFRAEAALASRSKRLECLRVCGYLFGQELEGHEAAELHILGLVDDTHSTTAELFDDAVVRDGLADERVGGWHAAAHLRLRQASQRTPNGVRGLPPLCYAPARPGRGAMCRLFR